MGQYNMGKVPSTEKLFIRGPAGRLEAILDTPADKEARASVVVCHPHPQHGGTMHNKVAHTLARTFVGLGFAALRFNFRGTQASEGSYDNGDGELEDALLSLDWMRDRYPAGPCWLAGFSFGAAIGIRAAVTTSVDGLISVAPAVDRFAAGLGRQPACPWLIVQGDADELVDVDATIAWVNGLDPGPELLIMPGVGHFFHGNLNMLRDAVTAFVSTHLTGQA
jgi:alpha/beta superfamily hydrolase